MRAFSYWISFLTSTWSSLSWIFNLVASSLHSRSFSCVSRREYILYTYTESVTASSSLLLDDVCYNDCWRMDSFSFFFPQIVHLMVIENLTTATKTTIKQLNGADIWGKKRNLLHISFRGAINWVDPDGSSATARKRTVEEHFAWWNDFYDGLLWGIWISNGGQQRFIHSLGHHGVSWPKLLPNKKEKLGMDSQIWFNISRIRNLIGLSVLKLKQIRIGGLWDIPNTWKRCLHKAIFSKIRDESPQKIDEISYKSREVCLKNLRIY